MRRRFAFCLLILCLCMAHGPEQPPEPIYIADGFDAPVGTEGERHSAVLWPDSWYEDWSFGQPQVINSITQYAPGVRLTQGYLHNSPVYAAASGIVTYTGEDTLWDGVLVIRHDPLYRNDGMTIYTRYRYLREIEADIGQRVARGQAVASIGDYLCFDVSTTDILASDPLHNPAESASALYAHYSDPREFIAAHRPRQPQQNDLLAPPAQGIVSQRFHTRHPGIDIDIPLAQPVNASAEGVVIWTMDCLNCRRVFPCGTQQFQDEHGGYGYGRFVMVRHEGILMPPELREVMADTDARYAYVLYAHLLALDVGYGDTVEAGTPIGRGGATGCTSSPAVHVEVRVGSAEAVYGIWLEQRAINPELVFGL